MLAYNDTQSSDIMIIIISECVCSDTVSALSARVVDFTRRDGRRKSSRRPASEVSLQVKMFLLNRVLGSLGLLVHLPIAAGHHNAVCPGQPTRLHHQVGEPPAAVQSDPEIETRSNFSLHFSDKLGQIVNVERVDLHPDIAQPSLPGSVGKNFQTLGGNSMG